MADSGRLYLGLLLLHGYSEQLRLLQRLLQQYISPGNINVDDSFHRNATDSVDELVGSGIRSVM